MFSELTVSGEVPVIPVFSNPVGLITCKEVVFPSGRHSAVAVNLRRVVQNAGRLIQEKVRKECSCVVSGSARCRTWRDEDEV